MERGVSACGMQSISKPCLTLHGLVKGNTGSIQGHIAVNFDDGGEPIYVTYRQLHNAANKISQVIFDCHAVGEVIGVAMEPGPYLPSVLLGILSSECAFYCFEPQATDYVLHVIRQNGVRHIFTDSGSFLILTSQMKTCKYNVQEVAEVAHPQIQYITLLDYPSRRFDCEGLAYCITTSGTTGLPKVVHVSHRCIVPNIIHLRELFSVKETDLLFLASPLTFDPSIVDIFVALSSGATILIIPHVIKLMPNKLLDMLHNRHSVSVMQATPALISRMGPMLAQSLLGNTTSLRVLALGGEKFPAVSLLRQWRASSNRTRIFNLYGTTELSCWATYYEITNDDLCRKNWNVPLGSPLMGTEIRVLDNSGHPVISGDGQLYIGGKERDCHIAGESSVNIDSMTMRDTGDWVTIRDDGSIEYVRRKDDQNKRNGRRINLQEIEKAVDRLDIDAIRVILADEKLIVCVQPCTKDHGNTETMVMNHLRSVLPLHYQPDVILSLSSIPMTRHGKLDKTRILEMARYKFTPHNVLDCQSGHRLITDIWKLTLHQKEDTIKDEAMFVLSGGDSFQAIKFVDMVEFSLNRTLPLLLDTVLHKPFCKVIKYVLSVVKLSGVVGVVSDDSKNILSVTNTDISDNNIISGIIQSETSQNYVVQKTRIYIADSKKQKTEKDHLHSVDQSNHHVPLKTREFVSSLRRCNRISKISGNIIDLHGSTRVLPDECPDTDAAVVSNTDLAANQCNLTLTERWKYNTGKCVDASPLICLFKDGTAVVFIGSHSHTFYAVAMDTGDLLWRTELGDRVESSACLSYCGNSIIVGCYDCCVYVLETTTGAILWKFETGGEVKSSPVTDAITSCIYVGSHDKHLYALDIVRKQCVWNVYLGGGSVFSSPDVCLAPHHVYVATLSGVMTAVCPTSSNVLWRYECGKPVFSSPISTGASVCVGCVDGHVYCFTHSGQLMWKFITAAPVFSSPALVHNTNDCVQSSHSSADISVQRLDSVLTFGSHDEYVYCVSLTGEVRWKTKLDSPAYSSPCGFFVPAKHTRLKNISLNFDLQTSKPEIDEINGASLEHSIFSKDCTNAKRKPEEDCPNIVMLNNFIAIATIKGIVYILNSVSGNIVWEHKLPGEVFSSPVVCGRRLIIGCRDNCLYCLDIYNDETNAKNTD